MKKQISPLFMFLGILFCVCLILSNILATKLIIVGGLSATAGLLVFPISYIINDIIVEVWGYSRTRQLIWVAFGMNFLVIILMQLSVTLPPAPYWTGQDAYAAAFSQTPRIACASLVAFLAGSFTNAYIMSRMKIRSQGKRFGLRAVISTLFGETADSLFFFTVAFAGVIGWKEILVMILVQSCLKSIYEVVVLPVTIPLVRRIKRMEQTDIFDDHISYHILRVKEVS